MSKVEELILDWRSRARHCALIHAQYEKTDRFTARQALTAKEVYMTCARNLEALSVEVARQSSLGSNWPII